MQELEGYIVYIHTYIQQTKFNLSAPFLAPVQSKLRYNVLRIRVGNPPLTSTPPPTINYGILNPALLIIYMLLRM